MFTATLVTQSDDVDMLIFPFHSISRSTLCTASCNLDDCSTPVVAPVNGANGAQGVVLYSNIRLGSDGIPLIGTSACAPTRLVRSKRESSVYLAWRGTQTEYKCV